MAAKILILFAHPALQKSRINRHLLDAVRGLEGVTVHDLYELYPEFQLDVKREQALLVAHELIVFQHPFYWYSAPALLKEWMDLVLEHGFAYGTGGTALQGKRLLQAISTGGSGAAYAPGQASRYAIAQLLTPFEQTARLCGMVYLPPFVVHGTHALSEPAQLGPHGTAYRRLLEALRDGQLTAETLRGATYLNDALERLHPTGE